MTVQILRDTSKETLTPSPDGVLTAFSTSQPYKLGTVSIWKNGVRKIQGWEDGFSAPGGTTITMSEAPLVGDSLQAQYEPA